MTLPGTARHNILNSRNNNRRNYRRTTDSIFSDWPQFGHCIVTPDNTTHSSAFFSAECSELAHVSSMNKKK